MKVPGTPIAVTDCAPLRAPRCYIECEYSK
jgi:hypothetical protein